MDSLELVPIGWVDDVQFHCTLVLVKPLRRFINMVVRAIIRTAEYLTLISEMIDGGRKSLLGAYHHRNFLIVDTMVVYWGSQQVDIGFGPIG